MFYTIAITYPFWTIGRVLYTGLHSELNSGEYVYQVV